MEDNHNISANIFNEKQKRYLPIKRVIDFALSCGAIVVLSPLLVGIAIAIKLDSPGAILFKQKRVGKDKELFEIWKFRTMQTETPKDMPTHMLSNPEQYITATGRFLRKTSLDELPQIFNIFRGQMSVIGPRPALWNQDDLVEERDKYGVNNVTPGLTGWAQINGRDELEIPIKAKFDGEYVKKMGFGMDTKCFFGTIGSVLSSNGVVEGGTGGMRKKDLETGGVVDADKLKKEIRTGAAVVSVAGVVGSGCIGLLVKYLKNRSSYIRIKKKSRVLKKIIALTIAVEGIAIVYTNVKRRMRLRDNFVNDSFNVSDTSSNSSVTKSEDNQSTPKRILITGANSYIGMSVDAWLSKTSGKYKVNTLDMLEDAWRITDFSKYDVVYHVAGIAHADVSSVTEEQKQLYYKVNTDLAVEIAEKAKAEGVKQFIFMSSMIVYSGCEEKIISSTTQPKPLNFYGDSKWQAEQKIRTLACDNFGVVVLRPPMIYGKGSKGNYQKLTKLASILPIFPIVKNKRSMLHIDNLCEFVKLMIDNEESGVFYPQNREYTNTSDMIQMIADVMGHKIIMIPGTSLAVKMMGMIPGKIGNLANKAFSDSAYEMSMSEYNDDYRVNSLRESVELTEGNEND